MQRNFVELFYCIGKITQNGRIFANRFRLEIFNIRYVNNTACDITSLYDITYFVAYSNKNELHAMHLYVRKLRVITWPPQMCLEYVGKFQINDDF